MLHHHLPPWATLKSFFKIGSSASPKKSSNGGMITVYKRSKPSTLDQINRHRDFDEMKHHREDRLDISSAHLSAGIELESLRSVDNCIEYATTDTFHDDRV